MPERRKCFYDERGNFRGYWPVWHDWPYGEQGFNVDYDGNHDPECPICGLLLRQTEPEPDYLGIETRLTVYVCEDCQTQYVGPIRERKAEIPEPEERPLERSRIIITPPERVKPVSIEKKYRYLIG